MKRGSKIYRDGKVHVMSSMCATCIFRSDSTISRTRVEEMIQSATHNESTIICHETMNSKQAACHGFFKLHPNSTLQIAERLGVIEWVQS